MPRVGSLPGGGEATIVRYERLLGTLGRDFVRAVRAGLWAAEAWPVSRFGRPFTLLSRDARERAIVRWNESGSRHERWLLRAILTPIKSAHFDDASVFEHVGCRRGRRHPAVAERAAWMQQVTDGRAVHERSRARVRGGRRRHRRRRRRGGLRAREARSRGAPARGRPTIRRARSSAGDRARPTRSSTSVSARPSRSATSPHPILAGRGVGGSTTINSGTCYRAPDHTLERWGERYGLTMLSRRAPRAVLRARRVDARRRARRAREHLGGSARVIARGAELLQLSHKPLTRNAPGCDGQGVCCFGCPTGAKRSTDVSYVPEALKRGAQLVTGARVTKVLVAGGRARGVVARLASGRTLTVRAEAVVVAGRRAAHAAAPRAERALRQLGLARQEPLDPPGDEGDGALRRGHRHVARHPAELRDRRATPREGLMFEGASTPLDVTAVAIPLGRAGASWS